MSARSVFRKMAGKPPETFDEVNYMTTRALPLPDKGNMYPYLRFTAEKDKHGRWTIYTDSNDIWSAKYYQGYKLSNAAVRAAIAKHSTSTANGDNKLNFDSAFMILRELEEAHLKYSNKQPTEKESSTHYMVAFRLLPPQFQEVLEDLYKSRLEKSDILPPKAAPALKPQPGGPKPG
jgi:hypothetical protein